jgi:Rrf2 family transcriptional regulator, nitric oxide-sensitive transcriptional repressor
VFSQTVEYALRSMSYLSAKSPDSSDTGQIAEATGVPSAYLAKVLQSLRKAGIVQSRRGRGGGITLARPPEDLTILEIVNAVDPLQRITKCPIGLATHGVKLCPMHSRLDEALAMTEEIFRETTLAELLAEGAGRGQRCKFPALKK